MADRPNRIHLLPERDRMMAETYSQNADGSANPTGEAKPQKAPHVTRNAAPVQDAGVVVGKVVEPPKAEKPAGSSTASTKGSRKKS